VAALRQRQAAEAGDLNRRQHEHRVVVAGLEERARVLQQRLDEIEARLVAAEQERQRAGAWRERLDAQLGVVDRLAALVARHRAVLDIRRAALDAERRRLGAATRAVATRLDDARRARHDAEAALDAGRERLRRVELDEAELRVRLEGAVETLRRDHDAEPERAVAAECPLLPEGVSPSARVRELEREVRLLGPINPLALEEFTALQERHGFLETQLEDVRSTRRDLVRVIRAVDEEIQTIFASAYADVATGFERLFALLFPGGQGRLVLTRPEDLLETGVEVEAKPSGKNVKKLSLLSGGERSLTALAFLFAVFRARPSPFYVMDEVEAALDDVNLHRFLGLLEEFRNEAQLLVVSHQKRTMEAADCLIGVSMQPGGSSKVLSERVTAVA
jgi:chromosome segregation protein